MKPADRQQWILSYAKTKNAVCLSVLDQTFVDEYLKATGAPFRGCCWGAHKCSTLTHDLSNMAKVGLFERKRVGLGYAWQPGFPRWVWAYDLPERRGS